MSWFKRKTKGIQTSTEEKKDIPQGLWYKSPTGKIIETEEHRSSDGAITVIPKGCVVFDQDLNKIPHTPAPNGYK